MRRKSNGHFQLAPGFHAPPPMPYRGGTEGGAFPFPFDRICPLITGPALFFVRFFRIDQVRGAVFPGGDAVDILEGA